MGNSTNPGVPRRWGTGASGRGREQSPTDTARRSGGQTPEQTQRPDHKHFLQKQAAAGDEPQTRRSHRSREHNTRKQAAAGATLRATTAAATTSTARGNTTPAPGPTDLPGLTTTEKRKRQKRPNTTAATTRPTTPATTTLLRGRPRRASLRTKQGAWQQYTCKTTTTTTTSATTTPATACSQNTGEREEDGTTTDEENAGLVRRRRRSPSWDNTPRGGGPQQRNSHAGSSTDPPRAAQDGIVAAQRGAIQAAATQLQLIHEVAGNLEGADGEVIASICAIALRMLRGATATAATAEPSNSPYVAPSATGEAYSSVEKRGEAHQRRVRHRPQHRSEPGGGGTQRATRTHAARGQPDQLDGGSQPTAASLQNAGRRHPPDTVERQRLEHAVMVGHAARPACAGDPPG